MPYHCRCGSEDDRGCRLENVPSGGSGGLLLSRLHLSECLSCLGGISLERANLTLQHGVALRKGPVLGTERAEVGGQPGIVITKGDNFAL